VRYFSEFACITEYECDDTKESFYKELEYVVDKLPEYHMKILLRDFT